jgi:hypothetical protein
MAKYMNQVTVTVKSGDTEAIYTAPDAQISGNGDQYHPILNIRLDNYKAAGLTAQLKERGQAVSKEDQHKKLVANHTDTIVGVLKQAETNRINSALKRERLEMEIAAQERGDRTVLLFAVHGALQAGLDLDEVTADMRDDHAGYVSDMAAKVYEDTDLDTLVNVS